MIHFLCYTYTPLYYRRTYVLENWKGKWNNGADKKNIQLPRPDVIKKLYTSFIRPHLEYAQPVWSPHLRKHIKMLKNVQIRATKLVDGMKNLEHTERLKEL